MQSQGLPTNRNGLLGRQAKPGVPLDRQAEGRPPIFIFF
jgi:hypothetical protein